MSRNQRNTITESWKQTIIYAVKGALVGIANIIPGVSGGTFALILGIYERLLNALNAIDMTAVRTFFSLLAHPFSARSRNDFKKLLITIDFWFLAWLGLGGVVVILGGSFLIDWLLVHYPAYTLSFFIGLIIPSIAVPWRMMGRHRSRSRLAWMIPGVALTVSVSLAFGKIGNPGDNLIWGFFTGMIAISAMILPGISGSFVLLVMGQYQNILKKLQSVQLAVADRTLDLHSIIWLSVFGLGCIAGLLLFARFLKFLLNRYRTATLAFLIGLIIGSFYVLWPFKDYTHEVNLTHISEEFRDRVAQKDDIRVATAPNRLPKSTPEVLWNLMFLAAGLGCAVAMNRLGDEESLSSGL